MNDSMNPTPSDDPKPDETFTWTSEPPQDSTRSGGTSTAASILGSVRDAVDELAERAAPTVRELSARAAELTAIAADRAAPLAKRAGEVTADASGKLAARSRGWASNLRSAEGTAEPASESTADQPETPGTSGDSGSRPSDEAGSS